MKILWSSNAFWASTGYGVQASSILPRFQALGHEVAQFAWYGIQGAMVNFNGIQIYPAVYQHWGVDVLQGHVRHFGADVVISLQDIWPLPDDYADLCRPAEWVCWFPIDSQPVAARVVQMATKARYPLTYSKFGYDEARRAGIAHLEYIPHGVETGVFHPGDKQTARQKLGFPEDAFVATMVAANKGVPSRKAFPENLRAFQMFREAHPELNCILYLHTLQSTEAGGVDFKALTRSLGIPDATLRYVDQYAYKALGIGADFLAYVYQASDVLLAASMSEGFGIPIIEAQACGCPVITSNYTSMPELTFNGYSVDPVQLMWLPSPLNTWSCVPSVSGIYQAIEQIHARSAAESSERNAYGADIVRANYDWDLLVRDWWVPYLSKIEQDIRQASALPVAVTAALVDQEATIAN